MFSRPLGLIPEIGTWRMRYIHQRKWKAGLIVMIAEWCLLGSRLKENLFSQQNKHLRLVSRAIGFYGTAWRRAGSWKLGKGCRTLWLKGESKHEGSWETLWLQCHPKQGLSAPHAIPNSYRLLFTTAEERISLMLVAAQRKRFCTCGQKVVGVNLMTARKPLRGFNSWLPSSVPGVYFGLKKKVSDE